VLFSALLRAKGIESELVLINLGFGYSGPRAPGFSAFNHMISWLPEFGLYADTTAAVAPFGTLPFPEYGKPVLHVGRARARRCSGRRSFPPMPPRSRSRPRRASMPPARSSATASRSRRARSRSRCARMRSRSKPPDRS